MLDSTNQAEVDEEPPPPRFLVKAADRGRMFMGLWLRAIAGRLDPPDVLLSDLQARSVSIVGNARSLSAKAFGADIEKYDLVIRFNLAPIPSLLSHGKRTDWLATAVPVAPARLQELGVRRVLWMSRRRRKLNEALVRHGGPLYLHPSGDVLDLARRAGVERPSTGLSVIDLVARSACARVDLFGFDFYQSRSLSGGQIKAETPHDYDREKQFVENLISRDSRFQIWQ